jgi:molecular chaperone DnaK
MNIRAPRGKTFTRSVTYAEAHAVEDKKRKEAVEAKNYAEAILHATEKTVAEHGAKLSDTDRRAIENAMADLREALKGNDATLIASKASALQQVSIKLGEAVYAQAQNSSTAAPESGKENIVDAEFTEVDDDSKKKSA